MIKLSEPSLNMILEAIVFGAGKSMSIAELSELVDKIQREGINTLRIYQY